jgi:hypothetical protein
MRMPALALIAFAATPLHAQMSMTEPTARSPRETRGSM